MLRGLGVIALFVAALLVGTIVHVRAGYVPMPLWSNGGLILGAKSAAVSQTVITPSYAQGCQFGDVSGTSYTSFSCTMASGATSGDVVVLAISYFGSTTSDISSVVDDKGDTCSPIDFILDPNGQAVNTYACFGVTSGATVYTVNLASSQQFVYLTADEMINVSFVDQHSIGSIPGTAATITTTKNGEFVWAMTRVPGAAITPGSGWTQREYINPAAGPQGMSETQVQATAGGISAIFGGGGGTGVTAIVAFQPQTGGTSVSTTLQNVYPHSTLLVGVSWCYNPFCIQNTAGPTVTSVTDSNGNTCSLLGSVVSTIPIVVYGCPQISTSTTTNDVVTANFSATAYPSLSIFASEWRNASGVFELENSSNVNSTSLSVATNGNTSRAREVIYGFAVGESGTVTPGQTAINGSSVQPGVSDEYQVGVVSGTVYTNTWAQGSTNNFNGIVLGLY